MAQIFPQADRLDKVLKLVRTKIDSKDSLKIADLLQVTTERQVSYYLSACKFLGLKDEELAPTVLGKYIQNLDEPFFKIEMSKIIVSKVVFGDVFFNYFLTGQFMSIDEISQLIIFHTEISSLSVAKRRAGTVISWIREIASYKDQYNKTS